MTRLKAGSRLLAAAAVATVLCLPYPLMALCRRKAQAVSPDVARCWKNDGSFAVLGLWGMETGDELAYAARVQEAARRWIPGNPFAAGGPTSASVSMDFLTYFAMGSVQRAVGNINLTWILIRWMCGFLWFLSLHAIVLQATRHRSLALAAAAFATLFSYLALLFFLQKLEWDMAASLRGLGRLAWTLASYGRTESVLRLPRPGLTYAALFGASLLWVRAVGERPRRWAVLSGLAGGALAYVRLDVWSTYMAGAAAFAALVSLREGRLRVGPILSVGISFLASLPWILWNLPIDPAVLERAEQVWGRAPDLSSLPYLAGFAAAWRWGRRPMQLWLGCLCLGAAAALNLQIVTGYTVYRDIVHWRFIGNFVLFLTLVGLAPSRWLGSAERTGPGWAATAVLSVLCMLQGAVFAALHYPTQALPRDFEEALSWLRINTEPDSVVAALGVEATYLLPVYSHNKTLLDCSSPLLCGSSVEGNARRLAYMLYLLGADPDRYFRACEVGPLPTEERSLDRARLECRDWKIQYFLWASPERAREALRQAWKDRPQARFPVDYLWLGHFERSVAGPRFAGRAMRRVYANSSVTLYRILDAPAQSHAPKL